MSGQVNKAPLSIVADIGGTNARFGTIRGNGDVSAVKIYQVREIPTLLAALLRYKKEHCADANIETAVLAVAGPVLDDVVQLTNCDWVCDRKKIVQALNIENVFVLNDFEAIALAVGAMQPEDVVVLQSGKISAHHPRVVMGPGTGLGIAALKPTTQGTLETITTEAGHIRYAAANEREWRLTRALSHLNFVSAENLISGPGLVNLYQANCLLVGDEPNGEFTAAMVVDQALAGDKLCKQVLDDFAAIFGSFASQIALTYNALGGLYLAGGVLQKMGNLFNHDRFLERFVANPQMSSLLRRIPVYRVQGEIPAFTGLRQYCHFLLQRKN